MKDTKYRFFFGVFVGFVLAGVVFFFFYRGTNAQERPASPPPRAAASLPYAQPTDYRIEEGALPPTYSVASYYSPYGVIANPGVRPAPVEGQKVNPLPDGQPVRDDGSPAHGHIGAPSSSPASYVGNELPPPAYEAVSYVYSDPSRAYPVRSL
jgi:hypothetical protein